MASYNEASFKKHLAERNWHRVYFLYGRERYLKRTYADRLIKAVCGPSPGPFDFQRFAGAEATARTLSDAVENLPMFADKKCVLVEDLDVNALPAQEYDRMGELISDLPDTAVLIFLDLSFAGTGKSRDKIASLIRLADQAGGVCAFLPWDKPKLARYVRERLARHGADITPEVTAYLLERVPLELDRVRTETDKLMHVKGTITKETIELLCPATLEVSAFDLARLILRRDYRGSLEKLGEFFDAREEPVGVLGALSTAFVDLYRAKGATLAQKGAADMTRDFGYKGREFRVKNAMRDAGKFEVHELRSILDLLAGADAALKSSKTDARLILEKAVMGIFTQMH